MENSSELNIGAMAAKIDRLKGRPPYSRSNPLLAKLLVNRRLNSEAAEKDTRHFEINIEGSGLMYEPGDSLGVLPTNCPTQVEELLDLLGYDGEEAVPGPEGIDVALINALLHHYDIRKISTQLLQKIADSTGNEDIKSLVASNDQAALAKFLWGREVIDLLLAFPTVKYEPREFVGLLKRLQPRLYSISSSLKAYPGVAHLTVAIVRYTAYERARKGVCSTFLSERTTPGTSIPVFLHSNKAFRLPPDPNTPIIMVGPGTGIAPFRAFLQERRALSAKGRNWLFFGDQRAAHDFLYRDEFETMQGDGLLTRFDTAFSRDQAEKVYVQHRMIEHAKELFSWLEDGAHLYICGDASRMAKDVDAALLQIIAQEGKLSADQASAYVKRLQTEKRIHKDVY